MKNTHLQHPEDTILTGDLSILDWFEAPSTLSVKMDGAPAIVWGVNPATGKFFVGTKSVFNKVKVKINETHEDIDNNHTGNVATILHACLDNLHEDEGIFQGDFIGFGGSSEYTPNTITYDFEQVIHQNIIIAPHTEYICPGDTLRDAVAFPIDFQMSSTDRCAFVQPDAWETGEDFSEVIGFARQMSQLVDFEDPKTAALLKQELNGCIREGRPVIPSTFMNDKLVSFWLLIKSIKDDMLFTCIDNGPATYINGELDLNGEGYVRTNEFGMFKLVKREAFSHANFNSTKSWA